MLLTDLREVKALLEIDPENTQEDLKLSLFIEQCSAWIEQWLDRGDLSLQSRTEYYNGTNTQKLLLRCRPVYLFPIIQVFVDYGGFYGSTSGSFNPSLSTLTFGNDFCIETRDGITSENGILVRINDFWAKPSVRQVGYLTPFIGPSFGSIKVIYTAGYTNDTLPATIRNAAAIVVAKLRNYLPLGLEVNSENYEELSVSVSTDGKNYILGGVIPQIFPKFRNWKF